MQVGFVGLGKMGKLMTVSLLSKGFSVVGYDIDKRARDEAEKNRVKVASDFSDFARLLPTPRIIFIMVPHGEPVNDVISNLLPHLSSGDILVDAGNSYYKDSIKHSQDLKKRGIYFLDAGTSGGLKGAREGVSFTIGGEKEAYEKAKPVFDALAAKNGVCYVGESGSGHFVKMVHNAIEYALLQSYAEGFGLLSKSDYKFKLDDIARAWNNGALIKSRILELCEEVLKENKIKGIKGLVRGETEDLVIKSIEEAWSKDVPFSVISTALAERIKSREKESFSSKFIAALRNKFGGHKTVQEK